MTSGNGERDFLDFHIRTSPVGNTADVEWFAWVLRYPPNPFPEVDQWCGFKYQEGQVSIKNWLRHKNSYVGVVVVLPVSMKNWKVICSKWLVMSDLSNSSITRIECIAIFTLTIALVSTVVLGYACWCSESSLMTAWLHNVEMRNPLLHHALVEPIYWFLGSTT